MKLTFRLSLSSDYHVASGQGLGGEIDSALFRDADGVPAIRGTLIEGLVREELRRLLALPPLASHRGCKASALGDEAEVFPQTYCRGDSPCPVCRIVGSPSRPKPWLFSSLRPETLADPVSARWTPGRTAAHVVSRVRVNPRLRRAEARKLFRQEEGDGRLAFVFTATSTGAAGSDLGDAALLVAAARMIRRFGLGRRRGRGDSEIVLVAADPQPADGDAQTVLLDLFERHWLRDEPLPDVGSPPVWMPMATPPTTGHPVRLRVVVRTDEPVLVSRRGEAGNQFESLALIPGGVVLGALAARAAATWNLSGSDATSEVYRTFVDLFRRGGLHCTALLPAAIEKRTLRLSPSIVTPRDLFTCKRFPGFGGEGHLAHGAFPLAGSDSPMAECPVCRNEGHTTPLQALGDFVALESRRVFTPERSQEMHIRMDPLSGRVEQGAFFGYVVMGGGHYFTGEITCRDEAALDAAQRLTEGLRENDVTGLRLGRAMRRGYGAVSMWCERLAGDAVPLDVGLPLADRVVDATGWLVMTLLSPAILVDDWGRHRLGFDVDWIEEVILPPGARIERREGRPVVQPFCAAELIDGFNLHLGLPRWRDAALVAGSSVGVRLEPAPALDVLLPHLERLEAEGIGLRREEGFGRVAFNHPIYSTESSNAARTVPVPGVLRPSSTGATHPIRAAEAERRVWLLELEEQPPQAFTDARWRLVARWLRHRAGDDLTVLAADLDRLGKAGFAGRGMPVGRGEKAFFDRAGLHRLKDLLGNTRNATDTALTARDRIEMLADWIAERAAAGKER